MYAKEAVGRDRFDGLSVYRQAVIRSAGRTKAAGDGERAIQKKVIDLFTDFF